MKKQLSVLYIEDNLVNITLVKILLADVKGTEYDYKAVNSLKEGLSVLQSKLFDIVLLDLGLPDSTGLEGVERLLSTFPEICLVVLTGNQDKTLAQKALEIGAQDYLDKEQLETDFLNKSLIFAHSRKIAERKLIANEKELQKLSLAVRQSPNTIVITDYDGKIEYVNPKFSELTGYTSEEAIGKNPNILSSGRQTKAYYENLWLTIKSGKTWKGNFVNIKKNGDKYWESATISPIKNNEGQITNFIAIKEDITEKVMMEEKLQQSNKRFVQVAELAGDLIWEVDKNGTYQYVSPIISKLLGYEVEEVVGKLTIQDLIDGSNLQSNQTQIEEYFLQRIQFEGVVNILHHKDGQSVWVKSSGGPIFDAEGQFMGFRGTDTNITELVKEQERLRLSNKQYTSLISNIQGMVYRCKHDRHRSMLFVSMGCKELTGYEDFEFIQNPLLFDELIAEEDRDEAAHIIDQSVSQGVPFTINYRISDNNGKRRWVHDRGLATLDGKGQVMYIEGIIYDITDRLMAQEMILNASMKTELQERSRISKEIHDGLQQTLTSSFLHFEGMRKEMDNIGGKLQSLFTNGYHLLNKGIEETRSIAHRLLPKVIEEYGLVEAIESLVKSMGDPKLAIEFYHNIPPEEQINKNLELVLYRIVQEATNNVMKYANASKYSIQLFLYSNQIVLTLEDNGKGFDMMALDQKLSGFGLMSMKSRADAVGGYLQIDSRPGKGTNIMVTIPISENNQE